MESKFFSTVKINDSTTMIVGLAGENCILFEGAEHALLFDGLSGAGSLRAFIREMTDKPVFMVLSHAHPDHEGAAFEYGTCFMHPDDIALMYSDFSAGIDRRLDFVNSGAPYAPPHRYKAKREDIIPPCPVKTYPVYNGDRFDLGGVELEVVHVPGHTRGSITLLDRKARSLYSADAINPNTLLFLNGSTTIEEYLESVQHLKTYQQAFDDVYTGHAADPVPATIVDDAIALCRRILARTDDALPEEGQFGPCLRASAVTPDFRPVCGGYSNICYLENRIYGRRASAVIKGKPEIG